jgi:hypothetical protein
MTLEQTDLTVEGVNAVRDRSFLEAYKVHDVGEEAVRAILASHGLSVEQHGDDARHADEIYFGSGPDLAVYKLPPSVQENTAGVGSQYIDTDTGQFVSLTERLELVGYIELKCKEDPAWFGRCNLRHFREYVNFANEVDVPVYIWFGLVDSDENRVLRQALFPVEDTDQIAGDVVNVSAQDIVFRPDDCQEVAGSDDLQYVEKGDIIGVRSRDSIVDYIPQVHGKEVVELNSDDFRSWPYFFHEL